MITKPEDRKFDPAKIPAAIRARHEELAAKWAGLIRLQEAHEGELRALPDKINDAEKKGHVAKLRNCFQTRTFATEISNHINTEIGKIEVTRLVARDEYNKELRWTHPCVDCNHYEDNNSSPDDPLCRLGKPRPIPCRLQTACPGIDSIDTIGVPEIHREAKPLPRAYGGHSGS